MRMALAGCALLAAAGAAWPQSPAPAPEKQAEQPPQRRPLNLRLDDPGKFGVQGDAPAGEKAAEGDKSGLPALGGSPKAADGTTPRSAERTNVFPKDTNPGH